MPDVGSITTELKTVSFTHPDSTNEEILLEDLGLTELTDYHLDFSNLLQQTTIRIFEKADQITYRLVGIKIFPDDYDTGVEIIRIVLDGAGQDMKITLQSTLAEGSVKAVNGNVRDLIRL